ncbi:MAG: hypothetical protein M3R08_05390 [Bacteroidota bacterium]|nr:hypothetical protein [Bacteroidota bacterium]
MHLLCQGQDAVPTGKGWMLGIGISPDVAYRTLQDKGEPYSSPAHLRSEQRGTPTNGLFCRLSR